MRDVIKRYVRAGDIQQLDELVHGIVGETVRRRGIIHDLVNHHWSDHRIGVEGTDALAEMWNGSGIIDAEGRALESHKFVIAGNAGDDATERDPVGGGFKSFLNDIPGEISVHRL